MAVKDPFRIKALFIALTGFFLLIIVLNFMNQSIPLKKDDKKSSVRFETKKLKRKNLQSLQKKPPKKSPSKAKTLKPKLDLAFATSGLDLGIDILGLSSHGSRLLSQAGETVMTEDVVDRLPEVQYREPISYPQAAKEKNLKGHVIMNILVNKEGEVAQVKLLDSFPEGVFEQAALTSIKSWSFAPAEYKGQQVSVWVKQKLSFQVN